MWFHLTNVHAHKTKSRCVRIEKELKQELGCRVSVLPIPAFHPLYIMNM